MINRLISQYNTLSYPAQIALLICGFSVVRIAIALIMDVSKGVPLADMAIDLLLLMVILAFVQSGWKKEFEKIHIRFGLIISLLLAFNFLQFGGIAGFGRFNYLLSIYFMVMVYSQRALYTTLAFNLIVLLIVLYISNTSPVWLQHIDFGVSFQTLDFWYTLLLIPVFTIYLKGLTVTQGDKLSQLNLHMAERVRESRKLGRKLEQFNQELKRAQAHLEDEVSNRTEMLRKKNQSVEAFIRLNTTELVQVVDELLASMQKVHSSSTYADKLKLSSDELAQVVESIRTSLEQNTLLNRKVIRSHERNA